MVENTKQSLGVDICRYLSYGLKAYCLISKQLVNVDFRCDLSGIILKPFGDLAKSTEAMTSPYQLLKDDKLKPILFPITCITEEITVNNETFIPLTRLAEIAFPAYEWGTDRNCVTSNTGYWFWFSEGSFCVDGTISNAVPRQSILFDNLNQWKIDYRGLINEGLAVSALELNNPYKNRNE